jgi:hypothetical protein
MPLSLRRVGTSRVGAGRIVPGPAARVRVWLHTVARGIFTRGR